jgi:hypothetical protein
MNEDLRGSVYDDLATLMTDLLTRKALLLVYWPLARGRRLRQSCEAVLRGYVADGPFDGRALDLACALAVVRKWRLDEEEQAAGSGGRLARALRPGFRRYFGRLAQSYLR